MTYFQEMIVVLLYSTFVLVCVCAYLLDVIRKNLDDSIVGKWKPK